MNVWEGVALALTQIRTEKLKSFFSLLGVIIGVMFLIVVVSVVEGLDRYIKEDFASQVFGLNTITVTRTPSVQVNTSREQWRAWRRRRRRRNHLQRWNRHCSRPFRCCLAPSRKWVPSGSTST